MLISTIAFSSLIQYTLAHMTMFTSSMYNFDYSAGEPNVPIGPGLEGVSSWWFRGPETRAARPKQGNVTGLIAGKTLKLEIACHIAFTSFGEKTTDPSDPTSACPQNPGAYHAGPDTSVVDHSFLSGCALAIADVDDINLVNFDNLVIFSVQQQCVQSRITEFEVPSELPRCTGAKCICAWFWLCESGTSNFYMTGFDCSVTPNSLSLPIAFPIDPCHIGDPKCSNVGAKRPLYSYNTPTNTPEIDNTDRPGYHDDWGFKNGAQNDIFFRKAGNLSLATGSSSKLLGNFHPSDLLAAPIIRSASSTKTISATLVSTSSPTSILTSSPDSTSISPSATIISGSSYYSSASIGITPSSSSVPSRQNLSPLSSPLFPPALSTSDPATRAVDNYCLTLTVTQTVTISTTLHATSSSSMRLRSSITTSASVTNSPQAEPTKSKSSIPPPPAPWSYPFASMYNITSNLTVNPKGPLLSGVIAAKVVASSSTPPSPSSSSPRPLSMASQLTGFAVRREGDLAIGMVLPLSILFLGLI